MEDLTIPGWRAWPKMQIEPSPMQMFPKLDAVVEEPTNDIVLKPMILDVSDQIADVPLKVRNADVPLKNQSVPLKDQSVDVPLKDTVTIEVPLVRDVVRDVPLDRFDDDVLVIKLKWSYVAQALVGILFVYMMQQFHCMSARLLVMETTLRDIQFHKV